MVTSLLFEVNDILLTGTSPLALANSIYYLRANARENYATFEIRPLSFIWESQPSPGSLSFLFVCLFVFFLWHHRLKILLRKLANYIIHQKSNSWFRFYLVNRTQICRVEGALSEASVLSFEVPQGTTISPNVIPFICRWSGKLPQCSICENICACTTQ